LIIINYFTTSKKSSGANLSTAIKWEDKNPLMLADAIIEFGTRGLLLFESNLPPHLTQKKSLDRFNSIWCFHHFPKHPNSFHIPIPSVIHLFISSLTQLFPSLKSAPRKSGEIFKKLRKSTFIITKSHQLSRIVMARSLISLEIKLPKIKQNW